MCAGIALDLPTMAVAALRMQHRQSGGHCDCTWPRMEEAMRSVATAALRRHGALVVVLSDRSPDQYDGREDVYTLLCLMMHRTVVHGGGGPQPALNLPHYFSVTL